jgi:hypothetical protein
MTPRRRASRHAETRKPPTKRAEDLEREAREKDEAFAQGPSEAGDAHQALPPAPDQHEHLGGREASTQRSGPAARRAPSPVPGPPQPPRPPAPPTPPVPRPVRPPAGSRGRHAKGGRGAGHRRRTRPLPGVEPPNRRVRPPSPSGAQGRRRIAE